MKFGSSAFALLHIVCVVQLGICKEVAHDDAVADILDMAAPTKVMSVASLDRFVSEVQTALQKERSLRYTADTQVRKLTSVLSETTSALGQKEKQLKAEKAKLQQVAAENAKVRASQDEKLRLLSEERALRSNLTSMTDGLNREKESSRMFHHFCEDMMNDVHKKITEEKSSREAAETNATDLGLKLAHSDHVSAQRELGLRDAKATLHQQKQQIADLTVALHKADSDAAELRSRLDQSEKVRIEKTKKLIQVSEQFEKVTKEDRNMIGELQRKSKLEFEKFTKQVKHEQQKRETLWVKERQQKSLLSSRLQNEVKTLASTDTALKHQLTDTEKSLQQYEARAQTVGSTLTKEHRSLLEAKTLVEQEKQQLVTAKAALLKAESDVQRVSKVARKSMSESAALAKVNKEQMLALDAATVKLQQEETALDHARNVLRATGEKLLAQNQARIRSEKMVQQLWTDVKQKEAKLKARDEEIANSQKQIDNLRKQLTLVASTSNETVSKLRLSERAKEQELKNVRAKLVGDEQAKKDLVSSREKAVSKKQRMIAELTSDLKLAKEELATEGSKRLNAQTALDELTLKEQKEQADQHQLQKQLHTAKENFASLQDKEKHEQQQLEREVQAAINASRIAAAQVRQLHQKSNESKELRQQLVHAERRQEELTDKLKEETDKLNAQRKILMPELQGNHSQIDDSSANRVNNILDKMAIAYEDEKRRLTASEATNSALRDKLEADEALLKAVQGNTTKAVYSKNADVQSLEGNLQTMRMKLSMTEGELKKLRASVAVKKRKGDKLENEDVGLTSPNLTATVEKMRALEKSSFSKERELADVRRELQAARGEVKEDRKKISKLSIALVKEHEKIKRLPNPVAFLSQNP